MQETHWHDIYRTLSPKLLGICRRYIKDIATAEDIVQDSFIVAIQKESDLKNKDALKGWLCRIVINRAINHLKNENRISSTSTENFEIIDDSTDMNMLELDKKSAILASDFSHEDLLEAIESLSDNHKMVFNLYIIDQFSHLEISQLLKISVGTSKSSLSRARKKIQQFLIDKLSNRKIDEKKKRRIAFLLFLGFGNQLFANYFKKSFSTFEIEPQTSFNPTRKVENYSLPFLGNHSNLSLYLTMGAFVFSTILLLFIFQEKEETPFLNVQQPNEKEHIFSNTFVDSTATEIGNEKTLDSLEKPIKDENIVNNTDFQVKKEKPKVLEISKPKDTAASEQEPPKVVVIKKQIVIRDTIYVEN